MNKKFTVLVGLLMAVAVTGYSVSGTYAKYTEDFTASQSSASVAKWDISLLDKDGADVTDTFTFDLFENAENSTLVTGADASEIIAPGSHGSFTIKVKNSSDVKAQASVVFTVGGAAVPLQYKVNNAADWSNDLDNIDAAADTIMDVNGEYEVKVEWQWPYEVDAAGNTADTALGTDSATGTERTTVTVDATVTVSQIAMN